MTGKGTGCGQLGGSSKSYVENTNVGLQKLGLMGISVFVASGDAGAASNANLNCLRRSTPIQPGNFHVIEEESELTSNRLPRIQ